MRWLRIAIGFTVTLMTLLCMLPAQAAQGSGWAVLLDEQGDLQLSDIRSARYTNQFSPIELDHLTAAEPDGAMWLRFRLAPGKHEQLLRVFAPDLSAPRSVCIGRRQPDRGTGQRRRSASG